MKRYWVGWESKEEDCRPLTFPPNEQIIGCWETGYTDTGTTMVALVEGNDIADATDAILKEWPEQEANIWRFFRSFGDDEKLSDRFPLADWMKERM